jgi:hypothetical protein
MMLYKPLDDPLWNNRLGYFNKSYTTQNDWWLNGDYNNKIVSCMNAAKNNADVIKDYFFIIDLSGTCYLYVSDTPFYVTSSNNKYTLLHGKTNSFRFNGDTKSSVNKTEYGQKDDVTYSKDYSSRAESVINTIVSNFPIFAWDEDIPSKIPTEGGAVTNLYS